MAAKVLRGRRLHPGVSFAVAPGSRQVLQMITRSGALSTFITAGARILESACGPCIGQGYSPAEDIVSVRTFNRNFAGRTGTKNDTVFLASPEVAIIAALTGELTDPRISGIEYPVVTEPESFDIDDWLIVPPPSSPPPIRRASTIGDPPKNKPLPESITGTVLVKVADKITTDHIMPAGIYLKLRSNIPEYAKVVFNCFNVEGQPTFAERAGELRDSDGYGIIVAGESYGQGSSREHAAICPMYLGIKAVIAKSFERIHRDNLVNFGILPLQFADQADYDKIGENGQVELQNIRTQLRNGTEISARLPDGTVITLTHNLTAKELDMVLAGGRLNMFA
jgi:aconitate hydratase